MSRYLLDTGIIIRHLRGRRPIVRLLRGLGRQGRLSISTITRLEIVAGMRPAEQFMTQKLLSRFQAYDVNKNVADRAGELLRWARQEGHFLSVPDAIIAATAVQHQLTLLTFNEKDFQPLPNISLYPIED
ncbi:MAG: type II toxin-antitoxin system VapC family toxin [Chloroflexota bacterium]